MCKMFSIFPLHAWFQFHPSVHSRRMLSWTLKVETLWFLTYHKCAVWTLRHSEGKWSWHVGFWRNGLFSCCYDEPSGRAWSASQVCHAVAFEQSSAGIKGCNMCLEELHLHQSASSTQGMTVRTSAIWLHSDFFTCLLRQKPQIQTVECSWMMRGDELDVTVDWSLFQNLWTEPHFQWSELVFNNPTHDQFAVFLLVLVYIIAD